MARNHRLPGNQPPQTLQVHPGGTQHALLVEAQQEVDECRRPEAGAIRIIQITPRPGCTVQARESVYVKL
jgi:hypothetical protein